MASVSGCVRAPAAPSSPPAVARAASVSPADLPVLPAQARIRTPDDFRATLREGVKAARPSLVLHARRRDESPSRAGFVVSRAVGGAVVRNRVKRRLRHLAAAALPQLPMPLDVVVRALPAAATGDLAGDFEAALHRCAGRLAA